MTSSPLGLLDTCGSPLAALSCLLRIIAELHTAEDLDHRLERVARGLAENVPFDVFAIWLLPPAGGDLELKLGLGLPEEWRSVRRLPFGSGPGGEAALLRRPVRWADTDAGVAPNGLRARLALPLLAQDRLLGVLELASTRAHAFDQAHEDLLGVLAPNLAVALENAALYRQLREGERRLADDLQAAREIHHYLLPRKSPWIAGLQTAVAYVPARHLGGDVYDFLPYGSQRTAIVVGDVAGKGTSAALYGSLAVGMLRGLAVENHVEPASVLAQLNQELVQLGVEQRFLALAFAVFDRCALTLRVAGAGLPFPLLVRGGEIEEISVSGVPLGIWPGVVYRQLEVQLRVGDVVVLTSDGIEEALDGADEPFGEARLRGTLCQLAVGSVREIADGLIAATDAHLGAEREPSDDRTVVVLKVVEGCATGPTRVVAPARQSG